MQVLVIGADGLLGSNLLAACQDRDIEVTGTYHSSPPRVDVRTDRLDITNAKASANLLDTVNPTHVVNCAAMTDVDACERMPDRAGAVNATAPGRLATQCDQRELKFVHISTDYVFDGETERPYTESDDPAPLQAYGESKLAGERAVEAAHDTALIPRVSYLYGIHRNEGTLTGFPAWVRDQFLTGDPVPLFTDQQVTPTRAGQAATTILALIGVGAAGRFHVAARSCVTPYEFGHAIGDLMGLSDPPITPSAQVDVDRLAPRPTNTCLDVGKLEATLDRAQPALETDLSAIGDAF